jgi:hypothetical protein
MFAQTSDGVDLQWQTVPVTSLVPDDFDVPATHVFDGFRLEMLGPEHNNGDYAAWTTSMEHIRATHGFEGHPWPHPMTLEENHADMVMHAAEFEARTSFTWSVLAPGTDEVIGCVYLYPYDPPRAGRGRFRSWVSADRAALDEPVRKTLAEWFANSWPIEVSDEWNAPQ